MGYVSFIKPLMYETKQTRIIYRHHFNARHWQLFPHQWQRKYQGRTVPVYFCYWYAVWYFIKRNNCKG